MVDAFNGSQCMSSALNRRKAVVVDAVPAAIVAKNNGAGDCDPVNVPLRDTSVLINVP